MVQVMQNVLVLMSVATFVNARSYNVRFDKYNTATYLTSDYDELYAKRSPLIIDYDSVLKDDCGYFNANSSLKDLWYTKKPKEKLFLDIGATTKRNYCPFFPQISQLCTKKLLTHRVIVPAPDGKNGILSQSQQDNYYIPYIPVDKIKPDLEIFMKKLPWYLSRKTFNPLLGFNHHQDISWSEIENLSSTTELDTLLDKKGDTAIKYGRSLKLTY